MLTRCSCCVLLRVELVVTLPLGASLSIDEPSLPAFRASNHSKTRERSWTNLPATRPPPPNAHRAQPTASWSQICWGTKIPRTVVCSLERLTLAGRGFALPEEKSRSWRLHSAWLWLSRLSSWLCQVGGRQRREAACSQQPVRRELGGSAAARLSRQRRAAQRTTRAPFAPRRTPSVSQTASAPRATLEPPASTWCHTHPPPPSSAPQLAS